MSHIITFLGDVALLNNSMKSDYRIEGEYIFNLEYVITENLCNAKRHKVNLRGDQVDFDLIFGKLPLAVSLANNHTMDYGVVGLKDTVCFLKESNVSSFGAGKLDGSSHIVLDINGIKLALFSYSFFNEKIGGYGVSYFEKQKFVKDLEIAKDRKPNYNIISMHWGEEESPMFNKKQQEVGRFLIDSGADLVVGHHSHCVQPFEVYKGKYIFYGLGNCVFPDFEVDSFYDEKNNPTRKYRKRQLKHNTISYGVKFDTRVGRVVGVDRLIFHNLLLRKIGFLDLKAEPEKIPSVIVKMIKQIRKYQSFVWSNVFVDGRLFDLNALMHEVDMKKESWRT